MTPASDPYRTLGLDPGATSAEIKRAYRRLAKAYHPDSAGERALPHFLAIQAAYERLTSGQPGTRSGGADGGSRRTSPAGPPSPPPSRPWSADAERARATRDAFRKRSTRAGARSGPAAGATGGSAGPGSASGSNTGRAGAGAAGGPGSPRPGRSTRRGRPKATIGSTSYDGTESEPFEPGWSGAGWYGAASGTYWTINPKEYADPRKHGPEYLARARRGPKPTVRRGGQRDDPDQAADVHAEPDGAGREPEGAAARPTDDAAAAPAAAPQATDAASATGRESDSRTQGVAASEGRAPSNGPGQPVAARPRPVRPIARPASMGPSPIHAARFGGLEPARISGSWRGRLLLAALAWFPIGLAIFGVHGQVTGCSQFLAGCTDVVAWSVWIPQVIVFVLLLASPRLAWIAASGSIVLLCLVIPLAAVLTAGSGGRPPSVATTELLYGAMAVGWLAGIGIALSGRIPLPPWRAARVR